MEIPKKALNLEQIVDKKLESFNKNLKFKIIKSKC